jgi:Prokaryotic N-terminal methylation motif
LLTERIRGESGFSLVEVMVSIVIMTLAILPMMAMFDMGLHSATTGSNYDKGRMLANLKLEQAKNLPLDTLRDNFPEPAVCGAPDPDTGYCQSGWQTEPGADFANFQYRIEKQYMAQPSLDPEGEDEDFYPCPPGPPDADTPCEPPTDLIKVTVTVRWPNGNEYTTLGLVARDLE